jgi:EmrB/QacA subfamily drug resistance transporter
MSRPGRLLTEPPRPAWLRDHPQRHWFVVGTVCIGAFMGQLDASIVTLALPTLRHDFQTSIAAVEWVALAYLLVLVSSVVAIGRLADTVGRKLLYTYGFGVFILGSALCGLAPSLWLLVVARVLQAAGAAMLQANSVALIVEAMPAGTLGRGIGVQGAAQALGLALGPAVGGLLIGVGGWRLIFFINVPLGLVGLLLGWYLLPRSHSLQKREPFDWIGASLITPAVGAVLLGVSFGEHAGWTSPGIVSALCGGVVLTTLFVMHERRTEAPMIDLTLFRRVPFSAGVGSGLLSYLVMFGVLFVVPFYFETTLQLGAVEAGLRLTALPLALAITAPWAGRLADRIGPRTVTAGGMLVTAAGLVALAIARRPLDLLMAELAVVGVGLGAFTPANNAAIMGSAPRAQSGVAGGILNMTRGLGTSFGVAITGLAFAAGAHVDAEGGPITVDAARRGFVIAVGILVACSVVAAGLSMLRGAVTRRVEPVAALEL